MNPIEGIESRFQCLAKQLTAFIENPIEGIERSNRCTSNISHTPIKGIER